MGPPLSPSPLIPIPVDSYGHEPLPSLYQDFGPPVPSDDPFFAVDEDSGALPQDHPPSVVQAGVPQPPAPELPHPAQLIPKWPGVTPITTVSSLMGEFLRSSPPLFVLPAQAECYDDGVEWKDFWLSSDEAFVGSLGGDRVVAFRGRTLSVMDFQVQLKRLSTTPQPTAPTLLKRLPRLLSHVDWCSSHPQAWSHSSADGTTTFTAPQATDILLPLTKPVADSKTKFSIPWTFTNVDPPTAGALAFLQAPPLSDKAHLLPELTQVITRPVSPTLRNSDAKTRAKALAAVAGLLMAQQGLQSLEVVSSSVDPETAAILEGARSMIGAATQAWAPLAKFLLEEASLARSACRRSSAALSQDADIRSHLVSGSAASPNLFHPDAVAATIKAVATPAPRQVNTSSSSHQSFRGASSGSSTRPGTTSYHRPEAPTRGDSFLHRSEGFTSTPQTWSDSQRRGRGGHHRGSSRYRGSAARSRPYSTSGRGRSSARALSEGHRNHRPRSDAPRTARGRGVSSYPPHA